MDQLALRDLEQPVETEVEPLAREHDVLGPGEPVTKPELESAHDDSQLGSQRT